MDGVYAHIDEVKGKLKEKLEDNKELAYLSRKLAEIDLDAPLDADISSLAFGGLANENTRQVFEKNGFKSLIKRLGAQPTEENIQPSQVDKANIEDMKTLTQLLGDVVNHPFIAIHFGDVISVAFADDKQYDIYTEHSLLQPIFFRARLCLRR